VIARGRARRRDFRQAIVDSLRLKDGESIGLISCPAEWQCTCNIEHAGYLDGERFDRLRVRNVRCPPESEFPKNERHEPLGDRTYRFIRSEIKKYFERDSSEYVKSASDFFTEAYSHGMKNKSTDGAFEICIITFGIEHARNLLSELNRPGSALYTFHSGATGEGELAPKCSKCQSLKHTRWNCDAPDPVIRLDASKMINYNALAQMATQTKAIRHYSGCVGPRRPHESFAHLHYVDEPTRDAAMLILQEHWTEAAGIPGQSLLAHILPSDGIPPGCSSCGLLHERANEDRHGEPEKQRHSAGDSKCPRTRKHNKWKASNANHADAKAGPRRDRTAKGGHNASDARQQPGPKLNAAMDDLSLDAAPTKHAGSRSD
jgi:hypothetical protein